MLKPIILLNNSYLRKIFKFCSYSILIMDANHEFELAIYDVAKLNVSQYLGEFFNDELFFSNFPNFKSFLNKSYQKKSEVSLLYTKDNSMAGNLVILLTLPGDGTGNNLSYQKENLTFSKGIPPVDSSIPRNKDGVFVEGMMPLFSFYNGEFIDFTNCLDELILDKNKTKVQKGWGLGVSKEDYVHVLEVQGVLNPQIYFTKFFSAKGNIIGDPHAIINNSSINALQASAFLSIPTGDDSLIKYTDKWSFHEKYASRKD